MQFGYIRIDFSSEPTSPQQVKKYIYNIKFKKGVATEHVLFHSHK